MSNSRITPDNVRQFLLTRYSEQIKGRFSNPADVPDSFDFLTEGVVDSFGILEMVSAVEKEFGTELDMAGLEAEQMTVLGPLSRYISQQVGSKNASPR